ncbi:MAG: hypothetical protein IKY04_03920, partial [Lachnospiraceae bacterium]|nr:hypothetical protein [Lachnospiraceae bacterium]
MANLIIDTTKIKVFERLKYLAEATGKDPAFADSLWESLLKYEDLYDEFVFYLENGNIRDGIVFRGYSLIDLYVHRIDCYNIVNDTGKNTAACNKESMILETFKAMADLKDNPDDFIRRMNEGRGMD